MEYDGNGELTGFLVRPKIASLAVQKDENGIKTLKEVVKSCLQMNRVLSEPDQLYLTKKKTVPLSQHHHNN